MKVLAAFLLCGAIAMPASAQTFVVLHSFDYYVDGANPSPGSLVQGTNGNLFGTTFYDPYNGVTGGQYGGSIFEMTPAGKVTVLYRFCAQPGCSDGSSPIMSLFQGSNGNFYGTAGTIFETTPKGTFTKLYTFCSQPHCPDGSGPSPVVQGRNGNFYGTTGNGGANGVVDGTIFEITPKGKLTTLYSFCSLSNCADGQGPMAGVIQATDGNFYGTTYAGGAGAGSSGTVFKITPTGAFTSLYSFCSQPTCADGALPVAGLVQASNGNLYGTTFAAGAHTCSTDCGTVFEITPEGKLTTLYSFCSLSNCADGAAPEASLIQATDGDLYGTTAGGGTHGKGTVFKITLGGKLTTLHSFSGADGALPYSGLVQATDGKFYGATYQGGTNNVGVVFSLSTGLRRFVKAEPTSGKVGSRVEVLGTRLTGATAVSFNGTSASFEVCTSGKAIDTVVPAGATSGTITVTLPSGTLTSNVTFTVLP